MNQTPPKLIFIVVVAIALLAFIGLASLCGSMFLHTYADPAILTAIITITGGLVGSLGTILSSPRTQPPQSDVTTQSTVTTVSKNANPTASDDPTKVTIVNPPSDPANVTEIKP